MGKKLFDERKPMHKNAADLHEMLDSMTKSCFGKVSIDRAKYLLGSIKRIPKYLQKSTLHDLESLGLIKMSKFEVEILPI